MTEFQKTDDVPVRRKVDYNLEEELAHSRLLFFRNTQRCGLNAKCPSYIDGFELDNCFLRSRTLWEDCGTSLEEVSHCGRPWDFIAWP